MNKFRFTIQILAVAAFVFAIASMAQAQATRTWVSGVGDDANPCSRTAPCKTWAGAISKTAVDGEIDALDPGGFGAVTITKSITLDGSPTGVASILNAGVAGIIINITSETAPHNLHTVILRALTIQGAGSGTNGIRIIGGQVAGLKVEVENCFIDGQNGSPGRGIEDFRSNGGTLNVINTLIVNTAAAAIVVDPAGSVGGGSGRIDVAIAHTRVVGTGQGMNFGSNVKATIFDSTIVGVPSSAIFAIQTSSGATDINVDHCVVTGNATGFNAATASTTIRVSNTTATNNTTLFAAAGGGQVLSYGNNQAGGAVIGSPVAPGETLSQTQKVHPYRQSRAVGVSLSNCRR